MAKLIEEKIEEFKYKFAALETRDPKKTRGGEGVRWVGKLDNFGRIEPHALKEVENWLLTTFQQIQQARDEEIRKILEEYGWQHGLDADMICSDISELISQSKQSLSNKRNKSGGSDE